MFDLEVVVGRDMESRASAAFIFKRDEGFAYSDLLPNIKVNPTPHFLFGSLDHGLKLSPFGFRHFGDGRLIGGWVHGGETIKAGEFAAIKRF